MPPTPHKPAVARPPVRVAPAVTRAHQPAPAAKPAPARVKIIEDGLLARMAQQDKFVREFPFLREFAAAAPCYSCADRRRLADISARVRRQLAALPEDKRKRLREMLNAETVEIRLPGPRPEKVVF